MVMMLPVNICSRLMLGWADCAAIVDWTTSVNFVAGCVCSKSSSLIVQLNLKRYTTLSKLLVCALPANQTKNQVISHTASVGLDKQYPTAQLGNGEGLCKHACGRWIA